MLAWRDDAISTTTGRFTFSFRLGEQHHPVVESFILFRRQAVPPVTEFIGVFDVPHASSITCTL